MSYFRIACSMVIDSGALASSRKFGMFGKNQAFRIRYISCACSVPQLRPLISALCQHQQYNSYCNLVSPSGDGTS